MCRDSVDFGSEHLFFGCSALTRESATTKDGVALFGGGNRRGFTGAIGAMVIPRFVCIFSFGLLPDWGMYLLVEPAGGFTEYLGVSTDDC
jgi:hypothetical protein